MIRPRALQATLGLLLAPIGAHACPDESLSCIPKYHLALDQQTGGGFTVTRSEYPTTSVGLGLGADFFPLENLSVGAYGGALAARRHEEWSVAWSAGLRGGYNLPISRRWSFWPRAGLLLDNEPQTRLDVGAAYGAELATVQYRTLSVDLSAPVLVHPNRHFFVGFGPRVTVPIYAHAANVDNPLAASTFGLQLLVGGHF